MEKDLKINKKFMERYIEQLIDDIENNTLNLFN